MKRCATILFFTLILIAGAPLSAAAQNGAVAGTVTEEATGEPLPGANVQVAELGRGVATAQDGQFRITGLPAGAYTLRVSFVGYLAEERPITITAGQTLTVDMALRLDVAGLEELVVTGYRVEQKREVTGSMSTVRGDEIRDLTAQSPDQAVQGRAAGVRVTSSTGQPGGAIEVQIRGNNSINAGNQPLYIIDGVQVNDDDDAVTAESNPLAALNPDDIQSIEILKDVAASSIYGAQAANGVVLITTKRGQPGRTRVSFGAQVGSVSRTREVDVLSAQEFSQIKLESVINGFGDTEGNRAASIALFGDPAVSNAERINTNWQDAIYRNGVAQTYNIAISGGDPNTTFYLSGNYQNQEGQIIESSFQRGTFRANVDHRASDRVSIESKVNVSSIRQVGTIEDALGTFLPQQASLFLRPDRPIFNEDGSYNTNFVNDIFSRNIVQLERLKDRAASTTQLLGSAAVNVQLADGYIARSYVGVGHKDIQEDEFDDPRVNLFGFQNGFGRALARRETNFNVSQTLSIDQTLAEKHVLGGVAGAEFKQEDEKFSSASGVEFPNELFRTLQSAGEAQNVTAFETRFRVLSFFGNAKYTYDDRYITSATLRYDGSSRFGEDQRFGLFYSGALAWRLSSEAFMDATDDWLDDLKLRVSYGITGNSEIGNFAARSLFGTAGIGRYLGISGALRPGVAPTQLGNARLTWEENEQINIGLDFSLFGGRLNGAVDLYRERAKDLLLNRPLPLDSGFGSISDNVGTVENRGIEIEIGTVNLDRGGFRWDTNVNVSFPRQEVIDLGDEDRISNTIRVGDPLGQIYAPVYAGVNPSDGRAMWFDRDGNITYTLRNEDSQIVGNSQPDFFGGLGNTFSYKGLSLDVFVQFDYGRDAINNDRIFLEQAGGPRWNQLTDVLDRWQNPGDLTHIPAPRDVLAGPPPGTGQPESAFSTRYVEDASYIRLKQLRLGYTLPRSLIEWGGFQRASVFVQGENLWTLTEYTGLDPELVGNLDVGNYPQSRRITTGVRLEL